MDKCKNCGKLIKKGPYCHEIKHKICKGCKKEFTYECNAVNRSRAYCSTECRLKPHNKCAVCGRLCKGMYCKEPRPAKCVTCGKTFLQRHCKHMSTHCSTYCASHDPEVLKRVKETQIKRYGSMGFNTQKQKETMIKKYGHAVPAKNQEVKDKIRKTQMKNNNGKFAFNTEKQKQTMMNKYGSLGRLGDPKEEQRQINTMLERYGVRTPSELPIFAKKAMDTIMKRTGFLFNNGSVISVTNKRFAEELKEKFNVDVEFEKQVDHSFFDLYIKDKNLLIDINPTVTHNSTIAFQCLREGCSLPCKKHSAISRDYHYKRALLAQKHGYKLIQIYDWDNLEKIINMLNQKLSSKTIKISAHKTKMERITQKEANSFLRKYHIQGAGRKQLYCYGLKYNDTLLAVATFTKSRFKSKAQWEFFRFAIRKGYTLFGASDKLMKTFIEEVKPKSIISYIDFNHTTSSTFLPRMGFKELEPTGPREVWTKKGTNKFVPITSLLMIGADRILGTNYGPQKECGLNNVQIMEKEGWVKVFTAGNRVFLWTKQANNN